MRDMLRTALERIKREPAVLLTLVAALIGLGASFGFELTKEQTSAAMALATALVGLLIRSQVTPNASVGAAEENDEPGGPLVAGEASDLPNDTAVDVVPAEDVYGALPPGGNQVRNGTSSPERLDLPDDL